jgi:hypothetical protein
LNNDAPSSGDLRKSELSIMAHFLYNVKELSDVLREVLVETKIGPPDISLLLEIPAQFLICGDD